jgi:site-specific recombinase XerD
VPTVGLVGGGVQDTIGSIPRILKGDVELAELETRPELLDRYIAAKRRQGLAPKTIANHLRTLSAMFEYARRRRWMHTNPVGLLEPLHVPAPETPVLSEQEIAELLLAYRVAEQAAEPGEANGGRWRGA